MFWNARPNSYPVLAFKGYERSRTNAAQFARLELRNTTSRAIWLRYSGAEFPLSPPFLERPIAVPPRATNAIETNVYSIRLGSFFMHGEKLLPGTSLPMDFPLHSGEPAKQVGISYYVGTFVDGNDFISNLGTPLLNKSANWKDKAAFQWQKYKRRLSRSPKHHEIWCENPLAFQAGISNNPTE